MTWPGMKLSATGRTLWRTGWAVPLLIVLWCAPSVARASCGDYVVTRSAHAAPMTEHAPDRPAPVPADPHKPCSGPNCSRAPVVPPLTPTTVTSPNLQEWGSLTGLPASVTPACG